MFVFSESLIKVSSKLSSLFFFKPATPVICSVPRSVSTYTDLLCMDDAGAWSFPFNLLHTLFKGKIWKFCWRVDLSSSALNISAASAKINIWAMVISCQLYNICVFYCIFSWKFFISHLFHFAGVKTKRIYSDFFNQHKVPQNHLCGTTYRDHFPVQWAGILYV